MTPYTSGRINDRNVLKREAKGDPSSIGLHHRQFGTDSHIFDGFLTLSHPKHLGICLHFRSHSCLQAWKYLSFHPQLLCWIGSWEKEDWTKPFLQSLFLFSFRWKVFPMPLFEVFRFPLNAHSILVKKWNWKWKKNRTCSGRKEKNEIPIILALVQTKGSVWVCDTPFFLSHVCIPYFVPILHASYSKIIAHREVAEEDFHFFQASSLQSIGVKQKSSHNSIFSDPNATLGTKSDGTSVTDRNSESVVVKRAKDTCDTKMCCEDTVFAGEKVKDSGSLLEFSSSSFLPISAYRTCNFLFCFSTPRPRLTVLVLYHFFRFLCPKLIRALLQVSFVPLFIHGNLIPTSLFAPISSSFASFLSASSIV